MYLYIMGMAFNSYLYLLILGALAIVISSSVINTIEAVAPPVHVNVAFLNRSSFPAGFIFGTASSSYQYEGAAHADGKGPSTWDTLTHKHPEKIMDRSNGDVAVDQYHRYKEDVEIMKYMNTDAYRFSISWPRILPRGKISAGINQKGIKYYNNLIDELLANGLQPFVTLFHWDLPQALEDEYSGFLSPDIINDFQDYAELCFKEFGDRVKHWTTFNEPWSYSILGGSTEPYVTSHNQLLAHAAAVKIYKTKYQASQKGLIGISLNSHWFLPFSKDKADRLAAQRALDFMFGWFMQPLTRGKYPKSMQSLVGSRLPNFTKQQSKLLTGSFDFIGLNYYTTNYAANIPNPSDDNVYLQDSHVNTTTERNGTPIGPRAASDWLYIYPRGIRELLLYTKRKYKNPVIYITENGMDELNDPTLPLEEALMDTYRIDYFHRHLYYILSAIEDGEVKVKGYFAWSLLDNFEWIAGYTRRFGINYVDYKDNLKRHQKLSAHWFRNFLEKY